MPARSFVGRSGAFHGYLWCAGIEVLSLIKMEGYYEELIATVKTTTAPTRIFDGVVSYFHVLFEHYLNYVVYSASKFGYEN